MQGKEEGTQRSRQKQVRKKNEEAHTKMLKFVGAN